MLFTLEKERQKFLMYLYCIVIVILYCPLKEVFLYKKFQLGPESVRCKEVSNKNCPLHRGFLIRILYETNPFLKNCPLEGGVRYREVSLCTGRKAEFIFGKNLGEHGTVSDSFLLIESS